jgi:hypothetical protein
VVARCHAQQVGQLAGPESTPVGVGTTWETPEATSVTPEEHGLPDDALVCRGGTCTAERFRQGAGVTLDEAGKLHNVSVNSAPGKTLAELTVTIPNQRVGVTTAGEIKAAGGHMLPKPTARNPDHCVVEGLTPEEAVRLFTPTVRNPHR